MAGCNVYEIVSGGRHPMGLYHGKLAPPGRTRTNSASRVWVGSPPLTREDRAMLRALTCLAIVASLFLLSSTSRVDAQMVVAAPWRAATTIWESQRSAIAVETSLLPCWGSRESQALSLPG